MWAPKYLHRILTGLVGKEVEWWVRAFSERPGAEVVELNIQEDHMHLSGAPTQRRNDMKWWLTTAVIVMVLFCIAGSGVTAEQAMWVEIDNTTYGAKPDRLGPIGGGNGYANMRHKGRLYRERPGRLAGRAVESTSRADRFHPRRNGD